jgi:hypothetical protein
MTKAWAPLSAKPGRGAALPTVNLPLRNTATWRGFLLFPKRMIDVQKNDLFFGFCIGFVLCLILSGAGYFIWSDRTGGDFDILTGEYRTSQQRTTETIAGLERTIGEQRERIDDLTTSHSQLEFNIRNARGICEQALGGSEKTAGDIRSAIELSKTLTTALKDIDRLLRGGRSGSDSGNGLDNLEDL